MSQPIYTFACRMKTGYKYLTAILIILFAGLTCLTSLISQKNNSYRNNDAEGIYLFAANSKDHYYSDQFSLLDSNETTKNLGLELITDIEDEEERKEDLYFANISHTIDYYLALFVFVLPSEYLSANLLKSYWTTVCSYFAFSEKKYLQFQVFRI